MKYYLIKVHSTATENNKNFVGQDCTALYGKSEKMIEYTGSHAKAVFMESFATPYDIKKYGYTRKCDAKRNWVYKNPENTDYWKSTVEIIEVEA